MILYLFALAYAEAFLFFHSTEVSLEEEMYGVPAHGGQREGTALNLGNSSNPVEKANDLLVAQRQKHHGMSWTPHGSGALAAVEMVCQIFTKNLLHKEKLNRTGGKILKEF